MVFRAGAQACPQTPKAVAQTCSVRNVFVQSCRHLNFIKKEALAQMFSCEFCEISTNTFSYRKLVAGFVCLAKFSNKLFALSSNV